MFINAVQSHDHVFPWSQWAKAYGTDQLFEFDPIALKLLTAIEGNAASAIDELYNTEAIVKIKQLNDIYRESTRKYTWGGFPDKYLSYSMFRSYKFYNKVPRYLFSCDSDYSECIEVDPEYKKYGYFILNYLESVGDRYLSKSVRINNAIKFISDTTLNMGLKEQALYEVFSEKSALSNREKTELITNLYFRKNQNRKVLINIYNELNQSVSSTGECKTYRVDCTIFEFYKNRKQFDYNELILKITSDSIDKDLLYNHVLWSLHEFIGFEYSDLDKRTNEEINHSNEFVSLENEKKYLYKAFSLKEREINSISDFFRNIQDYFMSWSTPKKAPLEVSILTKPVKIISENFSREEKIYLNKINKINNDLFDTQKGVNDLMRFITRSPIEKNFDKYNAKEFFENLITVIDKPIMTKDELERIKLVYGNTSNDIIKINMFELLWINEDYEGAMNFLKSHSSGLAIALYLSNNNVINPDLLFNKAPYMKLLYALRSGEFDRIEPGLFGGNIYEDSLLKPSKNYNLQGQVLKPITQYALLLKLKSFQNENTIEGNMKIYRYLNDYYKEWYKCLICRDEIKIEFDESYYLNHQLHLGRYLIESLKSKNWNIERYVELKEIEEEE